MTTTENTGYETPRSQERGAQDSPQGYTGKHPAQPGKRGAGGKAGKSLDHGFCGKEWATAG